MSDQAPVMNRRERLRAQTLQEIVDSSFAIIDADGVHALSIAALARSMAMSAPAVYRYFPSRDALLAHLILLSYEQLTAAMTTAVEAAAQVPRTLVGVLVAAYRDWALSHRRRYGMLFSDRDDNVLAGKSVETPMHQGMAMLVDLLVAIQGDAPGSTSGDRTLDGQLTHWVSSKRMPESSAGAAAAAILIWTRAHGIISLELSGVFENSTIEARRLLDLEIDNVVRGLAG